jgi:hypothetical protein
LQKITEETAGTFDYDDYEVVFRDTNGREKACSGVSIDFDAKKIVINQKKEK